MAFFLHLGVRFKDSTEAPTKDAIEHVLNKAKDWYRYAPDCWIIYTARDAHWWAEKLRNIPGMEENTAFLISEMSLAKDKRAGWLTPSAWRWMNEKLD